MDDLLIRNARHIRLANEFGQHKMLRNILALQQNLKTLGDEPLQVNFDRSRRFWEVFEQGPKASSPDACEHVSGTFADHGCTARRRCSSSRGRTRSTTTLTI